MANPLKNILINSTLAFVSAFVFTTVIHEGGHFLSYMFFGAHPTLFHNYVQTPDQHLSTLARVVSALAGPVISLVQAVVFGLIVSKGRKNTASHLLFLWLSLLGYVNFFGYLVMTPLFTGGDTGAVAELLNIVYVIRIVIALAGFAVLLWIIRHTARNFSTFIPAELEGQQRSRYVYRLMFFPIMVGSAVNTLLAFPVAAVLSAIYPATSSYVIMSSFRAILHGSSSHVSRSECEGGISKILVFLALSAIILNRLLTFGVG